MGLDLRIQPAVVDRGLQLPTGWNDANGTAGTYFELYRARVFDADRLIVGTSGSPGSLQALRYGESLARAA